MVGRLEEAVGASNRNGRGTSRSRPFRHTERVETARADGSYRRPIPVEQRVSVGRGDQSGDRPTDRPYASNAIVRSPPFHNRKRLNSQAFIKQLRIEYERSVSEPATNRASGHEHLTAASRRPDDARLPVRRGDTVTGPPGERKSNSAVGTSPSVQTSRPLRPTSRLS